MSGMHSVVVDLPLVTAGDIAVINLESARLQSWSRFWQSPDRPGIAEGIVEQEQMTLQSLSDFSALDRLDDLARLLAREGKDLAQLSLIQAQVASTTHRFAEARDYLKTSEVDGTLPEAANRLLLSIDQACGYRLEDVLRRRLQLANDSGRLEDLVPLGALLADLREFDEADRVYLQALTQYRDVSPFAVAWVCFQLGSLWGELAPVAQPHRAANWYLKAIECVPAYVKARVHLAEIYLSLGQTDEAKALLIPAVSSGDPEVYWRLADVMSARADSGDAKMYLEMARSSFEILLTKHLLAFVDHGAEFYSGSGNDSERAFELANINLKNRPTLRAYEQTYDAATDAGRSKEAAEILTAAVKQWGETSGFRASSLADASS
jgi:tetratricopeptide (TPR) repeat protein